MIMMMELIFVPRMGGTFAQIRVDLVGRSLDPHPGEYRMFQSMVLVKVRSEGGRNIES
jgi:hypothetical protein